MNSQIAIIDQVLTVQYLNASVTHPVKVDLNEESLPYDKIFLCYCSSKFLEFQWRIKPTKPETAKTVKCMLDAGTSNCDSIVLINVLRLELWFKVSESSIPTISST